jgi:hypothetical protein
VSSSALRAPRQGVAGALTSRAETLLHRFPNRQVAPALAVVGLVALTTVVFSRQLFDHWTFPWDFNGTYTATPSFVASTIGNGHFAAWSPFVASGFPVDMNPQAGVYVPLWWLLGALGVPLTFGTLTSVQVAHVALGAIGVLLLARARRLPWPWAALAAVAYTFFGGFYAQAEHADYFRGFAYLPWLLWSLTPPSEGGRWARLTALPIVAWLIASGAYPGQLAAFGILGAVYLGVSLWAGDSLVRRRYRSALLLATVAAIGACLAVILPYVLADQAGEVYRIGPPTVSGRAYGSIRLLDFLGLYLNNFAWTYDGVLAAWAVGIPVVVGLALVRLDVLRRHLALVACAAVGLVLALTPKITLIGKAMIALGPLFPSRFPASDYKPAVAIALILVSVEGWRRLPEASRGRFHVPRGPALAAIAVGCVLVMGALVAPSIHEHPTRELWLVITVTVATVALVLLRPWPGLLVCALVALIVVDGLRETRDYRFQSSTSPWKESPSAAAEFRRRDPFVRHLSSTLSHPVTSRPARIPPWAPISRAQGGSAQDASGWMADGYRTLDYGGNIQRVLWLAERNPAWMTLLLRPWQAYVFPCAAVSCSGGSGRLPPPSTWRPSATVRTLSYGVNGIVYHVRAARPVLMVENELQLPGWRASTSRARIVSAGIPLRAWRLSAGDYVFTATYHEPRRLPQELAVSIALVAWIACLVIVVRQRGAHRPGAPPTSARNSSYSRM